MGTFASRATFGETSDFQDLEAGIVDSSEIVDEIPYWRTNEIKPKILVTVTSFTWFQGFCIIHRVLNVKQWKHA
ncbi:hypothetical protein MFLAVUS_008276 [Mucor flavus]|uniref:Uncharacterized protein n=1 Tax=Mucor flavus TaxID=439312 RepID=A0ABP9Z6R3_9FUNG